MFQENEIVNLLIAFASIPVLFHLGRRVRLAAAGNLLYIGFALILAAYVFTVVEGIFWHNAFNILEHLAEALAGFAFLGYVWRLRRLASPGNPDP